MMNEADILRLEDARYAGVVAKDFAALDRLFHDDLVYRHSNGVADSKASYLEGIRDGVWDYRRVDREDQTVIVEDAVALVFNKLTIDIVVRGVPRLVHARVLSVWSREGQTWRLIGVQSGAIPSVA
jgi:ketosteroid isomerase-like protein